jgi:Tfp pilus assembly protein PilO
MKHSRFNDTGDEKESWHLDKRVPVSIILVLCVQFVSGLWFIADIKKDVEILKAARIDQLQRDERQDHTVADAVTNLRADLLEMNRKLDRLIERGVR